MKSALIVGGSSRLGLELARFWENSLRDTSTMLDPAWVAKKVIDHHRGEFKYKFIRILREDPRVEVVETR